MTKRSLVLAVLLTLLMFAWAQAESEFFKTFTDNYHDLSTELANKPPAELAEISDFVYEKDVATFTFEQGKMFLLRNVEGRPTTAIFLGKGHATIDIPTHTERMSLLYASGDSVVDESFEMAFLRFSDDFDLRLKEKYQFEQTELTWRDFNKAQQGEFFFRPIVAHKYDNHFQLLRSLYERAEDGYFWIDFNRYGYSFDPNRPEEVEVAYEHEGGDVVMTSGALMQRREKEIYGDDRISDISYPTTALAREGTLVLGGAKGKKVDEASVELRMQINKDSLRFLSAFLHHNLKLDSVYYNGAPVDYWRRRDFAFIGVILPEYRYSGDTVGLQLWYHGKDYRTALPSVENPAPSPHILAFDIPSGYNYVMPAMVLGESPRSKYVRYNVVPQQPYRMFQFQPCVSGYDTIPVISDIGLTLNFLKSSHIRKKNYECFIPDEHYRSVTMEAFNYMTGRFGSPPGTFGVYVHPEGDCSMPGLMPVSQVQCLVDGTGGLHMSAANMAARQWFGSFMRPKTDRELWLGDALPDYLSLMYVSAGVSPSVSFGELGRRRNAMYTIFENDEDWPLAAGRRLSTIHRTYKGAWVLHMLRFMMFDTEKMSDRTFLKFLNQFRILSTSTLFSNQDFIKLAEKHYGEPLDWFFDHWLYGRNYPEYNVEFVRNEREDGHYLSATVATKNVLPDFQMPVMIRVEAEDGSSTYHRQMISGLEDSFELGPFATEPKDILYNEFYSVLSKDNVDVK